MLTSAAAEIYYQSLAAEKSHPGIHVKSITKEPSGGHSP